MPSLSRVSLIFRRELRDALRDRRTVFMVLVLPVLLYPALMLGSLQMAGISRESDRRKTYGVLVSGISAERLRDLAEAAKAGDDRFAQLRIARLPEKVGVEDAAERLRPEGQFEFQARNQEAMPVQVLAVA